MFTVVASSFQSSILGFRNLTNRSAKFNNKVITNIFRLDKKCCHRCLWWQEKHRFANNVVSFELKKLRCHLVREEEPMKQVGKVQG